MSYHNLSRQSNTSKNREGSSIMSQSSVALRTSPSRFGSARIKKKKVTQSALVRRGHFRIIDENGHDKTPKLLFDSNYQVLEEWQPTVLDYVDADLTSTGSQISFVRNFQQSTGLSFGSRNSHTLSLQMSFTNIANVDSYKEPTKHVEEGDSGGRISEDHLSETAASAFYLKCVPSREFYPPHSKVLLVCKETNSFTLLSLPSLVEDLETEKGIQVQEDNDYYDFITIGKGKCSRKLNTSEQQTPIHINTSQTCFVPRCPRKNNWTWVTNWKIYDEYLGCTEEKRPIRIPLEDQWAQILEDPRFINQVMVMERILGAVTYDVQQLVYKKSMKLNPLDLDVHFSYGTQTLWTYHSDKAQNKSVSAIAINPRVPDVIAVGYGKYYYKETDKGVICIWSVKNTKNPERCFRFQSSVTCLDFATWRPNMLAAGFLNGSLFILDVTACEKKILYTKDSILCNTYEVIFFTKWWIFTDIYKKQEERLMITVADGRVIQLRRRFDALVPFQMMRISKFEGKVKGINCLRRCDVEEIPMIRFPGARSVVRYPNDDQMYLVSGDDGTVHKCNASYFTQHIDVFLAHSGPVYALKFSPFCNKIFLTCGADGAVRLWAWEISEPLINLTTGPVPVQDAAWSPSNSTIIASISGPCLHIWDLRRKTYYPASIIYHPTNANYTTLQFTETGHNLMVGDIEGNVQVLGLVGMPFDQIYKEDVLLASIEKELVVKPKLLKLLKKSIPM